MSNAIIVIHNRGDVGYCRRISRAWVCSWWANCCHFTCNLSLQDKAKPTPSAAKFKVTTYCVAGSSLPFWNTQ